MSFQIEKYYLKSTSFFSFLSEPELMLLKNRMQRKDYTKGEVLFREGSNSRGVYLLRKGKVKIFQTNHDGKETIIYIYKKGDYFGYRPLLADEPHPVTAVAMEGVSASFIPREVFIHQLHRSPHLAKNILTVLSKEFSVWVNKISFFAQHGVKERVALALLILNQVYQNNDEQKHGVIAINRDDFAAYVGTAKETLVRMLRTFKDEKLITSKGTKIILQKPKAISDLLLTLG